VPEVHYRLCLRCGRAVPAASGQAFCLNDGAPLLAACPHCGAAITSPHGRFCGRCGHPYLTSPAGARDGGRSGDPPDGAPGARRLS
jgi:DNA-directed RNA polymerase subunit RPC12/RpoP